MKKDYQRAVTAARKCGAPETVSVVMAELAEDMREGLLALAVGAGLPVMAAVMEQDVTAVCGPKGRHDPGRTAVRHGQERGSVTLGGRRVPAQRPRIRAVDGGGELAVPAYELFFSTEDPRAALSTAPTANVTDRLPDDLGAVVGKRMRTAYHADTALAASAQLEALARELERTHPGAAGSLREGLQETLTVLRLNVPPSLARTLRSTNAIESMISIARTHSRNVKNWQNGNMALRWCAAGMIEARGQFRRVNGHLHLATLRTALNEHVAAMTVGAVSHDEPVIAA